MVVFYQDYSSLTWHLQFIYTINTSSWKKNKIFSLRKFVQFSYSWIYILNFMTLKSYFPIYFVLFCYKLLTFILLKILRVTSVTHLLWIKHWFFSDLFCCSMFAWSPTSKRKTLLFYSLSPVFQIRHTSSGYLTGFITRV